MAKLIQSNTSQKRKDNLADARSINGSTMRDGEVVYINGHTTQLDGGQGPWQWDATSTAADDNGRTLKLTDTATGRLVRDDEIVTVAQYGAASDGITDDIDAFDAAWASIKETGGTIVIQPGPYLLNSPWEMDPSSSLPYLYKVTGFGAEIKAGPLVTDHAFKIINTFNNFGVDIVGVHFNHRGNTTVGGCIDLVKASNCSITQCEVELHDTKAGYSAVQIGPLVAGDGSGGYWNTIDRLKTRLRSGGDGAFGEAGVKFLSNSNACKVMNCTFGGLDNAIMFTDDGVSTTSINAIRILNNDFEGVVNCIRINTTRYGTMPTGIQAAFNRVESSTNFVSIHSGAITAATKANPCAIEAAGHGFITGDTAYIDNVLGMTELNGNSYTVTVVDADNFTLDSTDSTSFTTYTSAGYTTKKITDANQPVSMFSNYLTVGSVINYLVNPASQFFYSHEPSVSGLARVNRLGGPSDFTVITEGVDKNLVVQNLSGGSSWVGSHLVLGTYHFWVDGGTGDFRMKNGVPTSAVDGVVIGTQT